MTKDSTTITVSAPGKVLLAGGYLVLEYPNVGLVVAADKRFYCSCSINNADSSGNGDDADEEKNSIKITVDSPQFHSKWIYLCQIDQGSLCLGPDVSNASKNGFVEKTLRVVLSYLWQQQSEDGKPKLFTEIKSIDIRILADNDFYSVVPHLEKRKLEPTPDNVTNLQKFLPCPVVNGETIINKTGLGSSAALVTSLVGCLLETFSAVQLPSSEGDSDKTNPTETEEDALRIAHNLAQISHCHAQGKVGSGFDVSSATFGSHVYRRFPKSILTKLLSSLEENDESQEKAGNGVSKSTAKLLCELTHDSWDGGIDQPLTLPPGIGMLLADVCGGSESPSMARKVLAWKEQQAGLDGEQKEYYWENLRAINSQITFLFTQLSEIMKEANLDFGKESKFIDQLSDTKADGWKAVLQQHADEESSDNTSSLQAAVSLLVKLRQAFKEARRNLKSMGDAAGVPIEPEEQTELADATMDVSGVLVALVPGAGGYDALACLYIGGSKVRNRIGKLWASRNADTSKGKKICSLAVQAGGFGGVHGLCVVPSL